MTEPDPPIFRLHEARAMLSRVDAQLGAMQAERARAAEARGLVEAVRRAATGNGGSTHADTRAVAERFRRHAQRLSELAAELESMGVQVKDLERGLVDWLAEREGRQVLLCWLRGEPDIAWNPGWGEEELIEEIEEEEPTEEPKRVRLRGRIG